MVRHQLKLGQLWQDVDTETQQTRSDTHRYIEWWMQEAAYNYARLERAQTLLTNPTFKRSHAFELINKAMHACRNANSEVQYNMRALSRLNA